MTVGGVTGALAAQPWPTQGSAAAATAGVIVRSFAWPEWIRAVAGAASFVSLGPLSPAEALAGIPGERGTSSTSGGSPGAC